MLSVPTLVELARRRAGDNNKFLMPDGSQQWQHRNNFKDGMEEMADGHNYFGWAKERCKSTRAKWLMNHAMDACLNAYLFAILAWEEEGEESMTDEIEVERVGWE